MSVGAHRDTTPRTIELMAGASSTSELVDRGLGALAEECGASLVVLYRVINGGIDGKVPASMPNPMALYASRYFTSCPLQEIKRRYNPDVAIVTDMIARSVVNGSEVFADFYQVHRIERHLSVRLSSEPHGQLRCRGLVLCRSARDRAWRSKDVDRLKRLRPVIAATLARAEQLDGFRRAARERDVLAALVSDLVPARRLVFDQNAKLVWASASALEVLERLKRAGAEVEGDLRAWVRAALQTAGTDGAAPPDARAMVFGREATQASLVVFHASPGGEPFALVQLGADSADRAPRPVSASAFGLSRAESAVLAVLLQGKNNREIARQLCVSVDTVRTHLKQIYTKMGVHSRVEAVIKARDLQSP